MTTATKPSTDSKPSRTIRRRRGLPTGRAVVGALLITLASVGLFVAYRNAAAEPSTHFVVLDRPIPAGQRITAADVHLEPLDLTTQLASTAFGSIEVLEGAVAKGPLAANHLVVTSEIILLAPGESADDPPWRELSFNLETSRAVDGTLRPGERIDLVATYTNAGVSQTVVVFADTPVLRITDASGEVLSTTGAITITVGLADPNLVLAAVNAIDDATALTVVRSTKAPGQRLPDYFVFKPQTENDDGADS